MERYVNKLCHLHNFRPSYGINNSKNLSHFQAKFSFTKKKKPSHTHMKHNIKNNNIKSIASKVQLTACSTHRLGEEADMGSEDYKEAKAAVPGDHSTSLAAMIDNAAAGSGEGMVVVAPGYEVCGMVEVDHKVE